MLLALESSCDETSVAVVHDGRVLTNVVASQIKLHAEYGGVVPELATREHLRNLPPVTQSALEGADIQPKQLDAIAATIGPGLPQALMIGARAAQTMAFALRKPFFGINHHEAHLYSPWVVVAPNLEPGTPNGKNLRADFATFQPNVSLIVSGGHTMLVHVPGELKHRVLGGTIDDAAGECFDKIAKLIGLPYPGGPELDKLAAQGNPRAFDFPRPLLHEANDNFSFSGLKTSVRYFVRDHLHLLENAQSLRDLCASTQAAIVQVLVTKTMRAAKRLGVRCVTASGGVTCNSGLRNELAAGCAKNGFTLRLAEKSLCTDNAAMIGILAERKLLAGHAPSPSGAEINVGWALA